MSMTRRGFLKIASLFTVTSIAAIKGYLPSIPSKSTEEIISETLQATNGILNNMTFILDKPLEFFDCEGVVIQNCYFSLSDNFVGKSALVMEDTKNLYFTNNTIDTANPNITESVNCISMVKTENSVITSCSMICNKNYPSVAIVIDAGIEAPKSRIINLSENPEDNLKLAQELLKVNPDTNIWDKYDLGRPTYKLL